VSNSFQIHLPYIIANLVINQLSNHTSAINSIKSTIFVGEVTDVQTLWCPVVPGGGTAVPGGARCQAPGWDLWSANVGGTSGDRSCREAGHWALGVGIFYLFFASHIHL